MGNNYYPQGSNRQEAVRHTISLPQSSYTYKQREEVGPRPEQEYTYQQQERNYGQDRVRQSQFDPPTQKIDLESRSSQRNYEANNPQPQQDNAQMAMVLEELRMMRAQQDKINNFQAYISNELTSLKNRMNQLESDVMLSKTLSGNQASSMRPDLGQF